VKYLILAVGLQLACGKHPAGVADPSPVTPVSHTVPASLNPRDVDTPYRTIEFSGYTWIVRTSHGEPEPPESNLWSNSEGSVWVDGAGLHLTIRKIAGEWYSSEVELAQPLGYGTYTWVLAGGNPDFRHSVFAMYAFDDKTRGEIDIELSQWGWPAGQPNIQYMVQPLKVLTTTQNVNGPATHSFNWSPDRVLFEGKSVYHGAPVPSGQDSARMELWTCAPCPGYNEHTAGEFVVSSFSFTRN